LGYERDVAVAERDCEREMYYNACYGHRHDRVVAKASTFDHRCDEAVASVSVSVYDHHCDEAVVSVSVYDHHCDEVVVSVYVYESETPSNYLGVHVENELANEHGGIERSGFLNEIGISNG